MRNIRKVLIVDDEPEFADACCRTFETGRYQVLKAADKSQALKMMTVHPDVVVLGTLTPAGEAFSLQQWIKQHPVYRNVPVVVVDAEHYERRWKGWRLFEGLLSEADEYMSKPLDSGALLPIVNNLMASSRVLARV